MLDPQFKAYLDTVKKLPELPLESTMRKAFADAGWSAEEVNEAILYVKPAPRFTPPPTPQVKAPIPAFKPTSASTEPLPTQPRVAWPASNPNPPVAVSSGDGMVKPVVAAPVAQSAPSPLVTTPTRSRGRGMLVTVLIVILIALAGTAYAYVEKLGPFSTPPYDESSLATGLLQRIVTWNTFSYSGTFSFAVEKREPSVSLFEPIIGTTTKPSLLNELGVNKNISYSMDLDGAMDVSSSTHPRIRSVITAKGESQGVGAQGSLSWIVDKDILYVLGDLPPVLDMFGLRFSDLKNQWVRITSSDTAEAAGFSLDEIKKYNTDITQSAEQTRNAIKAAILSLDDSQVLKIISAPVSEIVDGVRSYRYDLGINRTAFVAWFGKVLLDNGVPISEQAFQEEIKDPEFVRVLEYLQNAVSISLWVNTKTGDPVKLSFTAKIAPGGSPDLADLQVATRWQMSFKDINKPVVIENPTTFLNYDDALIRLQGISKEEYEFQKRASRINSIRTSLEYYYDAAGKYPISLEELQTLVGSVNTSVVQSYSSNGLTYRLVYAANAPIFNGTNIISGALRSSLVPLGFGLMYAQGDNTATEKTLSLEADALFLKDTDKDKLSDTLEDYIGFNKNLKDSDKDDIVDTNEIPN